LEGEGEGVADLRFADWELDGDGDRWGMRGLRLEGEEVDSDFGLSEGAKANEARFNLPAKLGGTSSVSAGI
jgi:hypothetical protein